MMGLALNACVEMKKKTVCVVKCAGEKQGATFLSLYTHIGCICGGRREVVVVVGLMMRDGQTVWPRGRRPGPPGTCRSCSDTPVRGASDRVKHERQLAAGGLCSKPRQSLPLFFFPARRISG